MWPAHELQQVRFDSWCYRVPQVPPVFMRVPSYLCLHRSLNSLPDFPTSRSLKRLAEANHAVELKAQRSTNSIARRLGLGPNPSSSSAPGCPLRFSKDPCIDALQCLDLHTMTCHGLSPGLWKHFPLLTTAWMLRALKKAPRRPQRRPTAMQKIKVLSIRKVVGDETKAVRNQLHAPHWMIGQCLTKTVSHCNLDQLVPARQRKGMWDTSEKCHHSCHLVLQNGPSTAS